ncbi:MAG: chromate transporter [Solobacterium sp.]|nr:chromate transporter [Solobacterium sp.]
MSTFFLMCWEFFKTGLFAVGGGLATIPFLQEMSAKYGWFTVQDLSTMIAVSESTPGPIGINMATYIGNHMFGFLGGTAATLSLVAPSVIVIIIIAGMLERFRDSKAVKGVFEGLRPAVVGFILTAVVSIYVSSLLFVDAWKASGSIADLFNWKALLLFAALLAFYKWKSKVHPVMIIFIAALCGMIFAF